MIGGIDTGTEIRKHVPESRLLSSKANVLAPIKKKSLIKGEKKKLLPPGLDNTRIEGHPWWFSQKTGSGPQKFVFQRADNLNHLVCIVLESWGRRLYGSFVNAQHFWAAYYPRFKGKRCFYWINRSFEVPGESSQLHFDVEWFTPIRDPTAGEKPDDICTLIVAVR